LINNRTIVYRGRREIQCGINVGSVFHIGFWLNDISYSKSFWRSE